jgi:hypothetical protein
MRIIGIWSALAAMLLVAATAGAFARQSSREWRGPNYDKASEVTVRGEVIDVMTQTGRRQNKGVHVTVAGDDGTVVVHLGPASYLDKQNLALVKGDVVEIVGSRTKIEGEEVLLARSVKKGETVTVLRDEIGRPMWSRSKGGA